jgi:hypothetical protein
MRNKHGWWVLILFAATWILLLIAVSTAPQWMSGRVPSLAALTAAAVALMIVGASAWFHGLELADRVGRGLNVQSLFLSIQTYDVAMVPTHSSGLDPSKSYVFLGEGRRLVLLDRASGRPLFLPPGEATLFRL